MNSTSMAPGRTRRRVIALGLMLALGASALEALAGPVRDGSVHHESNVEASSHRSTLASGHNHGGSLESMTMLKPGAPSQADLAPPSGKTEHEHPGGDDHCAHVHGVALIPTVSLMFSAIVIDAPLATSEHHDDPSKSSIPHPPRA